MSTFDSTLDSPRSWPAMITPWSVTVAVLAVAVSLSASAVFITVCLFAVVLSIISTLLLPRHDRGKMLAAFLVALLARLATMMILHAWVAGPSNTNGFLYRDSFSYHRIGATVAGLLGSDVAFKPAYHTQNTTLGYHQLLGMLYAIFGVSHWIGKTVNCLLGAWSVLLTYRFARPLVGGRAAILSAWMLALWPTAIFWSVQLLKDMLVGFMVILAADCWVNFVVRRRWIYLVIYLLATAALFPMRFYTCAFLGVGLFVGLVVLAIARKRYLAVCGLMFAASAGCAILFTSGLVQPPDVLILKLSRTHYSPGSTIAGIAQNGASHWLLVPLAMTKFMITPLPWNAHGIDLLIVPGILLQYMILPFAARGAFMLLRRRILMVLPIVLVAILTNLLYALIFLGSIPRHMHTFYPFMFVCAAIGMQFWRKWVLLWCLCLLAITMGALAVLVFGAGLR